MIYLYKADLSNRIPILHAISVRMSPIYNGIGKFTMVLPADDYHIDFAEQDGIVYSTLTDSLFSVQCIKFSAKDNTLTLNGYTANALLNRRAATQKQTVRNVEADVLSAVSRNLRGLPRVAVASATGIGKTTEAEIYGDQLLDAVIPILDEAELGNKMSWNDTSRIMTFSVYRGRDLTSGVHAAVFSDNRGNAPDLIYADDVSTFANRFFVEVEYTDDTSEVINYQMPGVTDVREWWCRSKISQKTDETRDQVRERAIQRCKEEATKRLRRCTFTAALSLDDLGRLYQIGDKVLCHCSRLSVSFAARLTGVDYNMDKNGCKAVAVLGEPELTALDEMRLNR